MKIKVINSFRDKNTKVIHQVGEVLEVSDERGAEIISAGNYAAQIDEPKQAETPEQKQAETPEQKQAETLEPKQAETPEPKKEKKPKAKTNK